MSAFATVREYQRDHGNGTVVILSNLWWNTQPLMHKAKFRQPYWRKACDSSSIGESPFPTKHAITFARPCLRCFPGERGRE